jgi:hypothetical protein
MNRGASLIVAGALIGLTGTLVLSDPHLFAAKASATSSAGRIESWTRISSG